MDFAKKKINVVIVTGSDAVDIYLILLETQTNYYLLDSRDPGLGVFGLSRVRKDFGVYRVSHIMEREARGTIDCEGLLVPQPQPLPTRPDAGEQQQIELRPLVPRLRNNSPRRQQQQQRNESSIAWN
jgi:hypothetical protein